MEENQILQEEELEVIKSIYGEESVIINDYKILFFPSRAYPNSSLYKNLTLELSLPTTYPSSEPPNFKWKDNDPNIELNLSIKMVQEIEQLFEQTFIPGSVVLYDWLSSLEEYLKNNKQKLTSKPEPSLKIKRENKKVEEKQSLPHDLFIGSPIEDRKSVFIACAKKVNDQNEVNETMQLLLQNKKIAKATHNILAYRIQQDNGIIIQDFDDDGETAAGSRLLHLLQLTEVYNVMVVVSRYYGGIQLGPDRFKHINNAARQVLENNNLLKK